MLLSGKGTVLNEAYKLRAKFHSKLTTIDLRYSRGGAVANNRPADLISCVLLCQGHVGVTDDHDVGTRQVAAPSNTSIRLIKATRRKVR